MGFILRFYRLGKDVSRPRVVIRRKRSIKPWTLLPVKRTGLQEISKKNKKKRARVHLTLSSRRVPSGCKRFRFSVSSITTREMLYTEPRDLIPRVTGPYFDRLCSMFLKSINAGKIQLRFLHFRVKSHYGKVTATMGYASKNRK